MSGAFPAGRRTAWTKEARSSQAQAVLLPPKTAWLLALASCLVLFQELALIRWMGTQVRVLDYFPNIILLGSFLGLGLGSLWARQPSKLWAWPVLLAALVVATGGLGRVVFTQNGMSEYIFLLYYDLPPASPVVGNVWSPIVASFVLSAASFVPLGQYVARRLGEFQEAGRPLVGYLWDIAGAMAGVAGFTTLSWTGWPPAVWFSIVVAAGLVLHETRRARRWHAALGAAVIAAVMLFERAEIYSPYYALRVNPFPEAASFAVLANGGLFQLAFPVRRGDQPKADHHRKSRDGYHLPYRLLRQPPRRALVLGAGTGNDVAVLLDEGARHVDAVEIDPAILRLGRWHPDAPYASERVTVFNTDARSFLNGTRERYDLIIFGTLDSLTRLSAKSNVRLDNFVYTEESLAAARSRLTPDGGLAMYFRVPDSFIGEKLEGLVAKAFGRPPLVNRDDYGLFNLMCLAGPAFEPPDPSPADAELARRRMESLAKQRLPTDDWPYLYLRGASMSPFYLGMLAALAGLAFAGVLVFAGGPRRLLSSVGPMEAILFLFGLGFLLLETRAVTLLCLLWGATWITSAAVFGSILLMVFLSTLACVRRPASRPANALPEGRGAPQAGSARDARPPSLTAPWTVSAAGLALALLASAFVPVSRWTQSGLASKALLSLLVAGGPVFFAGLAFAWFFERHPASPRAFAWNLLGAVMGGLIEFSSMSLGLRAPVAVAAAAYAAAFCVFLRTRKAR
ncbi:MAG: hypothetical protein HY927_06750 [Elusimicrobia bacterium]|nr:hypothetical protein [Elusimicrobiota bacterium]